MSSTDSSYCYHHCMAGKPFNETSMKGCFDECRMSSGAINIPQIERFKLESQTDVMLWLIFFVISLLVIYLISQRNRH
jgi:hypothetical protein